jgi:hypothetical protein
MQAYNTRGSPLRACVRASLSPSLCSPSPYPAKEFLEAQKRKTEPFVTHPSTHLTRRPFLPPPVPNLSSVGPVTRLQAVAGTRPPGHEALLPQFPGVSPPPSNILSWTVGLSGFHLIGCVSAGRLALAYRWLRARSGGHACSFASVSCSVLYFYRSGPIPRLLNESNELLYGCNWECFPPPPTTARILSPEPPTSLVANNCL